MLKSLLPKEVKLDISTDDVRLKSNINNNQTLIFTKKSFFVQCSILGFTRSHSHPLDDTEEFYQLIAGAYKKKNLVTLQELIKFI